MNKAWIYSTLIFFVTSTALAADVFHLSRVRRSGFVQPPQRMSEFCIVDSESTEIQTSSTNSEQPSEAVYATKYNSDVTSAPMLESLVDDARKGALEEEPGPTDIPVRIYKIRFYETEDQPGSSVTLSSDGTGKKIRNKAPEAAKLIQFIDLNCDR